jgi:benzylsuccinate CoA-transferase BbsF subunit
MTSKGNGSDASHGTRGARRVLDGVKVLDLTWFGAGPIATRSLANLGADVVRVETQKRPDGLRISGPKPLGDASLNVSGYFNNFNAEKRSVTIDLTTERGHELGLDLVRWADIFMTNMTARAVRQIGLTWETVRATNPGIIAMYQPMQGMDGPHAEFGGFGAVLSTVCGVNYLAGFERNPPVGVGSNYPDYVVNPIHAVTALLAALRHKRRTGEGQVIDMSQLESSVAAMSGPLFAWDNARLEYRREGNRVPYAAPHGAFRCLDTAERPDRWLVIACLDDAQWQRCAEACGHAEWARDPRFATLAERKANEDALEAELAGWAAAQDGPAALARLQTSGVPAGLVLNATEVLADEQLTARGYFVYLDHAEAGRRAYDGSGFRLSRTPVELRRAAPLLGEHTWEIATDILGLSPDEIGTLIAEQVLY